MRFSDGGAVSNFVFVLGYMQEGSWYELKEYFKKVADDESKKKLKSHAQQKGYLQKLGLLIQPESWHYSPL